MKSSEIAGKKVFDINANEVGKVSYIEFDLMAGVVNSVGISPGLMKKKFEIRPEDIKTVGDTIILNVAKEDLI
ncbi:MAG: PRC-barrel domain-containing protein [Euryarchaeota archaeon]|nr:PRC-barrel domain-containing protein [Euryarchaeota archaeon]